MARLVRSHAEDSLETAVQCQMTNYLRSREQAGKAFPTTLEFLERDRFERKMCAIALFCDPHDTRYPMQWVSDNYLRNPELNAVMWLASSGFGLNRHFGCPSPEEYGESDKSIAERKLRSFFEDEIMVYIDRDMIRALPREFWLYLPNLLGSRVFYGAFKFLRDNTGLRICDAVPMALMDTLILAKKNLSEIVEAIRLLVESSIVKNHTEVIARKNDIYAQCSPEVRCALVIF
jgi:hypothetical protein